MHHFSYRDGALLAEDVDLERIADAVGTPFYCYSSATIERHFRIFSEAFAGRRALVCYAMKANSNQAVLKILAGLGAGMDVVSAGELLRATAAGVPGDRIIFSGVGKTRAELALGLKEKSAASTSESSRSCKRFRGCDVVGPRRPHRHSRQSRRRRENPRQDFDRQGQKKLRVPISRARELDARARALPGLEVTGVDMHIGSQITDMQPFDDAFSLIADFVRALRADGCRIDHVDLGGGLGIPYRFDNDPPPPPHAYAEIVARATQDLNCEVFLEPGRVIVGNAGVLVTEVIYVKRGEKKSFVIVDAAMERLGAPDALRCAPRDLAVARAEA